VGKRPQLIDLNNDLTNFSLTFDCKANPPTTDYKLHVATQTELDRVDIGSLPFKLVRGQIGGNIVADEDRYDNYYLIVQSEEQDVELEIRIDIQPVEAKVKTNPVTEEENVSASSSPLLSSEKWNPSKILFWSVFAFIVIFLIYYLFFRTTSKDVTNTIEELAIPTRGKTSAPSTVKNYHSVIDDINDL
jgi:energy-coupling factor transporter transmembrane protein EcfT